MKINKKFLSVILLGTIFFMLGIPNKSKAALQSNGGTPIAKDLGTWMLQIRKMQELGGTLGRTDTVNTDDLTSEASDLDIHMEKNTEYGAMAILSASAYGNPNKINDGETTTGNSTGVVINFNDEWTAATIKDVLGGYAKKYKNIYYTNYTSKIGDAISETVGWHGSSHEWNGNWSASLGILRGEGGIFGYYLNYQEHGGSSMNRAHHGRAAIVVGTDL